MQTLVYIIASFLSHVVKVALALTDDKLTESLGIEGDERVEISVPIRERFVRRYEGAEEHEPEGKSPNAERPHEREYDYTHDE